MAKTTERLKPAVILTAMRYTCKPPKYLSKLNSITFKECALAYINSHQAGWKNRKHEQQWRNTLETYAHPFIGNNGARY